MHDSDVGFLKKIFVIVILPPVSSAKGRVSIGGKGLIENLKTHQIKKKEKQCTKNNEAPSKEKQKKNGMENRKHSRQYSKSFWAGDFLFLFFQIFRVQHGKKKTQF